MPQSIKISLLVFFLGILSLAAFALAKDEEVQFFPTYAHWQESRGEWEARLRGWVFEPEWNSPVRKTFVKSLLHYAPPDADQKLFAARVHSFLVDTEEHKTVHVRWRKGPLRKIRSGEHGELRWNDFAPRGPGLKEGATVPVRLDSRDRTFQGRVLLIGPEGTSVVSDIDDTIKISSVTVHNELLANTFFRAWRTVAGMAPLYQRWAKEGAVFHYVSNSPWPLETELESFLGNGGFPAGTTHLRPFSTKTLIAEEIFKSENRHKQDVLHALLNDFPHRRFILVGDSGEQDAEIYGELARAFPRQVVKILIRRVTPDIPGRYEKAFAQLDRHLWRLFDEPVQIVSDVPAMKQLPRRQE